MSNSTSTHDFEAQIHQYLAAFEERDLQQCLELYDNDATVHFQFNHYHGKDAIAGWHRDRFDANLRILCVDDIVAASDNIVVDAQVASDRLRKWKFESLSVTLAFEFRDGRIRDLKCDMKVVPW